MNKVKQITLFSVISLFNTYVFPGGWEVQNSGTNAHLHDVYFIDHNTGWVVGDSGTIIHTDNGGDIWTLQESGTSSWLRGVHFTDHDAGWAVGLWTTILHTFDGGNTWNEQYVDSSFILHSVYFTDSQKGWAVGGSIEGDSGSLILHTTDGGNTWTVQSAISSTKWLDVFFINADHGWIAGDLGTYYTTDGGVNWRYKFTEAEGAIYSVYFLNSQTGWMVGDHNTCLGTTDGGNNWDVKDIENGLYEFRSVHFADFLTGWVVGFYDYLSIHGPIILHTNDGGNSWTVQYTDTSGHWSPSGHLRSCMFTVTDSHNGWAVGDFGTILHTSIAGVGIEGTKGKIPTLFELMQNYPNPFNPTTTIEFSIPTSELVTLTIYDVLGRQVDIILNKQLQPGHHKVQWDASNVPSGIYFIKMKSGDFSQVRKGMVVR